VGLIARPVALAFGIAYRPNAMTRPVENLSQVGLSGEIRRRNVSGAFLADPRIVRGKRVLLIDDIFTTGATMEACARALVDAQALQVDGLTLARSLLATQLVRNRKC
ncbi:MAG TPA: phosphoribosyltransferase family protein, partial [Anaerolineaceae bacterium]|nr:phosphoribosyltransferase family protein [Anaerolineaceae bacterium]